MGCINSIPIVSQFKSLGEAVIYDDAEKARQTQIDFLRKCIGFSQGTSLYYLYKGNTEEAKNVQYDYLNGCKQTFNGITNSVPGVGHIKGSIHYYYGDRDSGDEAMKSSSRTVGVIIGAVVGLAVGPAGAISGGIIGGQSMNGIITACDSKVHGKYKPYGAIPNLYYSENSDKVGVALGLVLEIGGDALLGKAVSSYYDSYLNTSNEITEVNNVDLKQQSKSLKPINQAKKVKGMKSKDISKSKQPTNGILETKKKSIKSEAKAVVDSNTTKEVTNKAVKGIAKQSKVEVLYEYSLNKRHLSDVINRLKHIPTILKNDIHFPIFGKVDLFDLEAINKKWKSYEKNYNDLFKNIKKGAKKIQSIVGNSWDHYYTTTSILNLQI